MMRSAYRCRAFLLLLGEKAGMRAVRKALIAVLLVSLSRFLTFPLSLLAALLLLAGSAAAADTQITAYVTLTNTPAGPPTNIVLNIGAADTRTWTNGVVTPSTSIQITNSTAASVTNLIGHLVAYPVYSAGAGSPQLVVNYSATNTSALEFIAPLNTNLSVSFGGNWATVYYRTSTFSTANPILTQTNAMSANARTNAANALVNLLGAITDSINVIPIGIKWLRNYADTNTAQVLGNKTFIAPSLLGGTAGNLTGLSGTNAALTNVVLVVVDLSRVGSLSGYATAITNGQFWSNLFYYVNLISPNLSNATLTGATTLDGSSLSLVGLGLNNLVTLSSTSTIASANAAIAFQRARGTNVPLQNTALGAITWSGWLGASYGAGASIQAKASMDWADTNGPANIFFSTTPSNTTTRVVRFTIGAEGTITVASDLIVSGTNYSRSITATNLVGLGGSLSNFIFASLIGTNFMVRDATLTGTNTLNGDLAYGRFSNTSMINGNNAGILIGTNVIVELSGATTIAQYAGFVASRDGDTRMIRMDGAITNIIVDANDGVWSPDGTSANRIVTGTGSALILTNKPSWAEVTYRAASSRWEVQRHSR